MLCSGGSCFGWEWRRHRSTGLGKAQGAITTNMGRALPCGKHDYARLCRHAKATSEKSPLSERLTDILQEQKIVVHGGAVESVLDCDTQVLGPRRECPQLLWRTQKTFL